jgi:hypothetical protein
MDRINEKLNGADVTDKPVEKRFAQNCINQFMQCSLCMAEMPPGVTPQEYQRLSTGFTDRGIQVWCDRHNTNVLHLDHQGVVHPGKAAMDPDDFEAAKALALKLDSTPFDVDVVLWGLAVAKYRIEHYNGSPLMVLRTFVEELDRFLLCGEISPEWQAAGKKIEESKSLIFVPGRPN